MLDISYHPIHPQTNIKPHPLPSAHTFSRQTPKHNFNHNLKSKNKKIGKKKESKLEKK